MLYLIAIFFLVLDVSAQKPSVIIVGAGPAGIAAATNLYENAYTNITILEAENRIGGRINSVKFRKGIIDLGAQYCHGEKGNIAYQLAKDYNILEPGLRGLQNNVYYSNGSRLDHVFVQDLQGLYHTYYEIEETSFNTTGKSLGELFTHNYNSVLLEKYKNQNSTLKLVKEGLRFLEGYIVIHEGAFSWFEPSAESDYASCEGNQGLIWKRTGYKGVLDIMMKIYPNPSEKLPFDDKIHLSTKVKKIIWDKTEFVKVVTDNKIFSANLVIFTPSVGVLKKYGYILFEPPLPSLKQKAIKATGFDGVMKSFIFFSTEWWKDEDQAFCFFWSDKDLKEVEKEMIWISQFRYILKVPDNPGVWVGWISGDLVPKIEKLSLEKFKNGLKIVLDKFLGSEYNVTDIDEIIRSDWRTNENFGGTYSFTKTGFYEKNISYQRILSEPLYFADKLKILFAGEATNPVHYSTVHGAIETGYREAKRIINL